MHSNYYWLGEGATVTKIKSTDTQEKTWINTKKHSDFSHSKVIQ